MANILQRTNLIHYFSKSHTSDTILCRIRNVSCIHRYPKFMSPRHLDLLWSRGLRTTQRLDDTLPVKMPSLSPTMTEGTIVKWNKKEGDKIAPGDVLCEIQTDKAVVSMEIDEEGILAKILVPENTPDVKVGTMIALTVEEGDDWQSVEIPPDAESPPAAADAAPTPTAAATPAPAPPASQGSKRLVGPAVKNYLRHYGLDSSTVLATGPHGTLTKGDVLKHVENNKISPVPSVSTPAPTSTSGAPPTRIIRSRGHTGPATYVDIDLTSMRKTIAKRLVESKSTIPHAYGTVQCSMNRLTAFRKLLKSAGLKLSVNDLIIKCTANALSRCPNVNVVWEGATPVQKGQIDISIAVATPTGLITPIVTNSGARDVVSIADNVRLLAGKARAGKLQPHEFIGGTFCISNLGMYGVDSFSAIINPPQCGILAVGGTSIELGEDGNSLSTSKLMLSYDARVIMEDDASKFLAILRNEVENINEVSMGIYDLESKSDQVAEDEAFVAQAL